MKISYIDGIRLKKGIIAGARRVICMQEHLNRINIFPVPDNDTGTNMALTMESVAAGAINCHERGVGFMSECLAESALMGARGNSGAILAQFFQGLSEKLSGENSVRLKRFGEAVVQARDASYEALSEPKEGTILTVMHDWSERIKERCHSTHDFIDLLKDGLNTAQSSLVDTPKKMKLLAKAGVVDAGAQGFVHLLEGIYNYIVSGQIDTGIGLGNGNVFEKVKVDNAPENIEFRFCTECFIVGHDVDKSQLRQQLRPLGNSLIVAGSQDKIRIHIHTNTPEQIFEIAENYGSIGKQKVDDMHSQYEKAQGNYKENNIGLVTDSACDLPSDFFIRHNIQIVPVQLSFGSETFLDRVTITAEEFYYKLENSKHYPKTSQPTPGDFKQTYKNGLERFENVISISLSGSVSGTLQAAQNAAKTINSNKLTVIDGKNVSTALGLVVAAASRAIEEGKTVDEVIRKIRRASDNVRFYGGVESTEYLFKGGRISAPKNILARFLNLKPILAFSDGNLVKVGSCFSNKSLVKKIMAIVKKEASGKSNLRFAVAHANAPGKAEWLKLEIENNFDVKDVFIVNVSPAFGAHAGPGATGVAFLGE